MPCARADGFHERFVTQRCRAVGRWEASRRLHALVDDIKTLGFSVLETEEEFTVYDSNIDVDAGWLVSKE